MLRISSFVGVTAILFAASGCQTNWELDPVEAPALNECRNLGTDELVIKQEAKLMMFGYTNNHILRLSHNKVRSLLPPGGATSQLKIDVHYDSLKKISEVDVAYLPGNPIIEGYLSSLEKAWEKDLQFTDFVRNVGFRVMILPTGDIEIKYHRMSRDKAPNPRRTCYTIPLTKNEARYLVPLDFPTARINMVIDRMPAKDDVRAYHKIRRRFISQFTGSARLTRANL